ncbi:sugar phosphate nucleotidyltransferase [Candidatus Omnitrophota bacterium]
MEKKTFPVVILCGGKGTRMGPESIPKPMFKIGGRPILWHIMKYYEGFGFRDFIILLGYKKEKIIRYFDRHKAWNIRFVDTGLNTNTGGRIKRIEYLIKSENFFVTYGDGLSDVDPKKLLKFHLRSKKVVTLTCVRPYSPFGILDIDLRTQRVLSFKEKPVLDHWVNGGFFVFNRRAFRYIKRNDILEQGSFSRIIKARELAAYRHRGFWECMDTYKDNLRLNQLWDSGRAPWAIWRRRDK